MSIQTELSRIINAKAAIKAAIEGKGITVPDATLLDGMAALIESIEAGGGEENIAYGTFTPSENITVGNSESTGYEVIHNLGCMPTLVVCLANHAGAHTDNFLRCFSAISYNNYWGNTIAVSGSYNNAAGSSCYIYDAFIGNVCTNSTFKLYGDAEESFLKSGCPYFWIAARIKTGDGVSV